MHLTMKQSALFFLFLAILFRCSSNPSDSGGSYEVSGLIVYRNQAIADVEVSLDNKVNYTSYSDDAGFFQIKNVPRGEYDLVLKKSFSDGTFLDKSSPIEVNADVYIESLRLPKAVYMYEPDDVQSGSAALSWSATDAVDFREYKLYRHTTSGLDENTGTLVHVSTSINDTTFTDNQLIEFTDYYYRVYVMNDFGRLGGSNIVSLTTLNQNLIVNGDFEEIGEDGFPVGWDFANEIFTPVIGSDAPSGQVYLYGNAERYIVDLSRGSVEHRVPYSRIEPGVEYDFSFWYYIEDLPGNSQLLVQFNPRGLHPVWADIEGPPSNEWQHFSKTFTAPENVTSDYYVRLQVDVVIPYNNEPWKVRVDNFSVTRKE